jgi:hypothetical protein
MLSQSKPSETFDPELVLQRVWQGDYPPTWRVFYRPVISAVGCLLMTLQVMIGLMALLLLCAIVLGFVTEKPITDTAIGGMILAGVITLVLIAFIVLLQRGVRRARSRASKKPRTTMVVIPEGVVAYRRKQTRAISFAHIAHMQLRVRAKRNTSTATYTTTNADGTISTWPITTTVPADPLLWLDLVFHSGQRGAWRIDILPQDIIAQSILEAYTQYRTQCSF